MVPGGVGGADHGFLVCVLAVGAALHQFEALPHLTVVNGGVLGVGFDLAGPLGQAGQTGEYVLDLSIGEERRHCKLVLGELELGFRSGATLYRRFTEGAPGAGDIVPFTLVGHFRLGLEGVFHPLHELLHGDGPGGHVLPAGLVDAHGDLGDVVEVVELPEGAQGVQHHLWIFLRVHQDALPVLEINDVQELVRHDQAVPGAEAVRHIAGEVQPLFDEDERVSAERPGFLQLFQHELHIPIGVGVHFIAVIRADGLPGAQLQRLFELVFGQSMSGGAFGCGFRLPVGELQLQPCRRVAVEPSVGAAGGENGVFGGRHQSTSASFSRAG